MKILVFKTVNENNLKRILEGVSLNNAQIDMVLPEKEISFWKTRYPQIHLIGTGSDYMHYPTLKRENKIPARKYDEVWILFSSRDRFYTYGHVYAAIMDIRFRRLVLKFTDRTQTIINNSGEFRIKIWKEKIMYRFASFLSDIRATSDKLRGYKG